MNPAATITSTSITELPITGCQPPTPLKEDFSVTWETSTIAIITAQQSDAAASAMIVLQGKGRLEVVSMVHRSRLESPIEVQGYPMVTNGSPLDFHAPSWANMWITVANCQIGDVLRVLSTNDADQPTFSIYHPLHDEEACATLYPISWRKSVADVVHDVSERIRCVEPDDIQMSSNDDDAEQKYAHSAFFNDEDDSSTEEDEEQSNGKVVIAFCGAKNVGKSTCLQYCWNQLLGAIGNQPLAILDADPGQPLCSMVGQLQVSLVQSPSGVSWTPVLTNVLKAHYFGSVTSETDPATYLQCIESLMDAFRSEGSAHVLLVNMDGWVKGLGQQILTTLLQSVVRPDHVIGLTGSTPSKSIDFSLVTKESQQLHLCTGYGVDASEFRNLPGARRSSLPSAVLRSVRLISYFLGDNDVVDDLLCSVGVTSSGVVDPDCEIAAHFASLVPFMVPIDGIAIDLCDTNISLSEDAKLMALNGSVVGLCRRQGDEGTPASLLSCVGLGVVRAVDKEQRILFILTPRTTQLDDTINILTVGSTVQLPLECYFRGVHSTGFPFLALEDQSGLDLIGTEIMKSRNGIGRRGLGFGPPHQQSRPAN